MVYIVGGVSEDVERLAHAVAERGIPCAAAEWDALPEARADLCILLEAPDDEEGRSVLAALARRRIPLFSTTRSAAWRRYGKHAICRLPCDLDADALASFLPWFGRSERDRRMTHELRLASELQRSVLPRGIPDGCPVNLARKYVPYQYIGGDFYDFISLEGGKLGLVIADACGHGISAAFLTAMFRSAFRLYAQDGSSPAHALGRLNTEFSRTLMADNFMSAFYAIIDAAEGRVTYCSAGHPPQLLFKASGEAVELSSIGFLLGSTEDARYLDDSLSMQPGDRLLLYTDGIVEAANGAGTQFGRERIISVVRDGFSSSIEQISSDLLSAAVMFLEDPTFQDDVTLIIAELAEEL